MTSPTTPASPSPALSFAEILPHPVEWLWPGRLPLGKLSLLDGDPERGKSLVTLDLAARLSTGRPWPDGQPIAEPANSIVLNGEDGPADTIVPRLVALGADLTRVFTLRPRPDVRPPVLLPGDTDALEAAVMAHQARLVILDPVSAFFDRGVAYTSDPAVRRALAPLAILADRHRCAVLLVRHLAKVNRGRALYRGLGSIGLIAMCRSAWLLAADPRQRRRRVLAQLKNNLAFPQPSLAMEFPPAPDNPPPGSAPVAFVPSWLGPTDVAADDLVTPPAAETPGERARDFLLEILRDGPRTARDIWNAAVSRGLSVRTLQRARDDFGIRSERRHEDGRTTCYWLLPGQQLPRPPVTDEDDDELDRWLDALRAKYPPSTPLDDL